jgi:hypothetical protein
MPETLYAEAFQAGKEAAWKGVLDFIEIHLNSNAAITAEDIANEIEYLQRKDEEKLRHG